MGRKIIHYTMQIPIYILLNSSLPALPFHNYEGDSVKPCFHYSYWILGICFQSQYIIHFVIFVLCSDQMSVTNYVQIGSIENALSHCKFSCMHTILYSYSAWSSRLIIQSIEILSSCYLYFRIGTCPVSNSFTAKCLNNVFLRNIL